MPDRFQCHSNGKVLKCESPGPDLFGRQSVLAQARLDTQGNMQVGQPCICHANGADNSAVPMWIAKLEAKAFVRTQDARQASLPVLAKVVMPASSERGTPYPLHEVSGRLPISGRHCIFSPHLPTWAESHLTMLTVDEIPETLRTTFALALS